MYTTLIISISIININNNHYHHKYYIYIQLCNQLLSIYNSTSSCRLIKNMDNTSEDTTCFILIIHVYRGKNYLHPHTYLFIIAYVLVVVLVVEDIITMHDEGGILSLMYNGREGHSVISTSRSHITKVKPALSQVLPSSSSLSSHSSSCLFCISSSYVKRGSLCNLCLKVLVLVSSQLILCLPTLSSLPSSSYYAREGI